MNLSLIRLSPEPCRKHIYEWVEGFGYFSNNLTESDIFSSGSFYCFIPLGAVIEDDALYDFKSGGRVFPYHAPGEQMVKIINYPANLIQAYIAHSLKDNKYTYLLLEDYYAKPSDPWVLKETPEYFLAHETMLYLLDKRANDDKVGTYYKMASSFPFVLFLTTGELKCSYNIGDSLITEDLHALAGSIKMVFFEV